MRLTTLLRELEACPDAVKWASAYDYAPERAWQECVRGDWMLWVALRLGVDEGLVVRAACACARPTLAHVPAGEDRPRLVIEAAEAWTRTMDAASLAAVVAAGDAVRQASRAALLLPAGVFYVALTAVAIEHVAVALADSSEYGAVRVEEVVSEAAHAARYAARVDRVDMIPFESSLADSAAIVRAMIPWEVMREAIGKNRTEQT